MKKLWIILGSVLALIVLLVGLYFIEESYTEVIIHGNKTTNTTIYEDYQDLGFDLFHNSKLIDPKDYTSETKNNVDTNVLGEYKVVYDIKYHLRKFHIERIVNVVDDVKPELTSNLDTVEKDYCTKKEKVKLTYKATDNYDGDLTDKIERLEKEDEILLRVLDSSGNEANKLVAIKYAKKPDPVFKLIGGSTVYVAVGGKYNEQGAGYYDGCGNKINEKITVSGSVDTSKEGTYKVTYTMSNGKKLTRTVSVYKPGSIGKGKIIYLTFDDGPGPYTQKILNTLAKYDVKATFFVTNQFPGYVYLIKNEYEAGHTVAVHTYTHNYNIYKSVTAYVNDFNKMNSVIEKYTGSKSKLFRFPGGSSNTVSRSYARGVVSQIARKMTSEGYTYFDWDITSGDASGANSTGIYNNVVNGARYCKSCVVLMHDIKSTTANALDNILKTLLERGYKFAALTSSSPTAHHSIAN